MYRVTRAALASLVGAVSLLTFSSSDSRAAARADTDVAPARNGLLTSSFASAYGLWVVNPDARHPVPRHLTRKGSWPSWSSDGRKVAFQIYSNRGRAIWTMNAMGHNRRKVIASGARPDWSPDDSQLAYVREDGVYIASANGRNRHRILRSTPNQHFDLVKWSPDGRAIALTAGPILTGALLVANPDGTALRQIGDLYALGYDWSQDGRYLAIGGCDHHAGRTIELLETVTFTRVRTLPTNVCSATVAWAPDGASIAYGHHQPQQIDRIWLADNRITTIVEETIAFANGFAWQPLRASPRGW